jgi:hypothetical protein
VEGEVAAGDPVSGRVVAGAVSGTGFAAVGGMVDGTVVVETNGPAGLPISGTGVAAGRARRAIPGPGIPAPACDGLATRATESGCADPAGRAADIATAPDADVNR